MGVVDGNRNRVVDPAWTEAVDGNHNPHDATTTTTVTIWTVAVVGSYIHRNPLHDGWMAVVPAAVTTMGVVR